MSEPLKESFKLDLPVGVDLPKENLIKVIAKTMASTKHPKEEYPLRHFTEEELIEASRSLFDRPVNLNHKIPIENARVVNAGWNDEDKVVEAILYLPDEYIQKIKNEEIKHVSVEYIWDKEDRAEDGGIIFRGLKFVGIALVDNKHTPGDSNAIILKEKRGYVLCEIVEDSKVLGEPFGKWEDFNACVVDMTTNEGYDEDTAKKICGALKARLEVNKGLSEQEYPWEQCIQDQLERYGDIDTATRVCAYIKHKYGDTKLTESKEPVKDKAEKDAKEILEKIKKYDELEKKVKEQDEALTKLQNTVKELETKKNMEIENVKKQVKLELIKKIEDTIPKTVILRQQSAGFNRLVSELKKTLYKEKESIEG